MYNDRLNTNATGRIKGTKSSLSHSVQSASGCVHDGVDSGAGCSENEVLHSPGVMGRRFHEVVTMELVDTYPTIWEAEKSHRAVWESLDLKYKERSLLVLTVKNHLYRDMWILRFDQDQ